MSLLPRTVLFLVALAALAQQEDTTALKVGGVYPPLARQARIQGDVRLSSGPEGVTVISGHPLLIPSALVSLKKLPRVWTTQTDVVYHFVLDDSTSFRVKRDIVKRGDAFDRLILRILRMKTEKVVERSECVENPITRENRIDMTAVG